MIIRKDNDYYLIKIYRDYLNDLDIYDYGDLSSFFKDIIIGLKDKYDIRGYCVVDVYLNDLYGMIIEIDNRDKYDDELEIKINFHIDCLFMCEINYDDLYEDIYYYNNKYYTTYKGLIDSNLVYKNSLDIINKGIRLK